MSQFEVKNRDFKPPLNTDTKAYKKLRFTWVHTLGIVIGVFIVALAVGTFSYDAEAHRSSTMAAISDSTDQRITMSLNLPEITAEELSAESLDLTISAELSLHTRTTTVKKGDTLTHIFQRVGLGPQDVQKVMQLGKSVKSLTRLSPGQSFEISLNPDNSFASLQYQLDETNQLIIKNDNNTLVVEEVSREFERRVTYSQATIDSSLFEAARKAGLSDKLTMDLAYVFGWDIDFALDIRDGDQFVVLYEELFLDGEKVRDGNIIAAEFINQGESFHAIRYTDANGDSNYYSEDGRSMRKAFLRTPVDFTRISSRFGKRHHPILKTSRQHKGVDYAAPRGTPVKAAGDGKIIWRGRKGGYGNCIIIKHANRYSTLYGHLNSYDRKVKSGSRVKQGQVIGYVGSTGRATGPHLHYEFRVNGVHRNPLTVKLPDADAIETEYQADFRAKSQPLLARLELIKNTNLALSQIQ